MGESHLTGPLSVGTGDSSTASTSGADIEARGGNIVTTSGSIDAIGTMSATGTITSTGGGLIASGSGTNVRVDNGDFLANAGTLDINDGGTETQATDTTTTVAISPTTHSGQITTFTETLTAGTDLTFQVTNTLVAAVDLVLVSVGTYGGTADGIPVVNVVATAAGSFDINIRNIGAVTLDAVVVINWALIKGSIT